MSAMVMGLLQKVVCRQFVFAELEPVLLNPVYAAKGAAGLIDLIRNGRFKKGERVVFLHTGGSEAMLGYDLACNFQSS